MDRPVTILFLLALIASLLAAGPAVADYHADDSETTTDEPRAMTADSPHFNGKLVFADDSLRDIYIMDVPSETAQRLTNDEAREWGLRWSPFGSKIAYLSTDGIWVMGSDGSGRYQLTDGSDRDRLLEWSPDASQIAFSRSPGDCSEEQALCSSEVWVVDADGSNLRKLAGSETLHAWDPAWSPDGSRIVFTRGDIDCWTNCDRDIWLVDADGSNQRNMGSPGRSELGAAWSPDGSQIAFSARSAVAAADIYVMNSDGSGLVNLTFDGDNQYSPAWSPDGSKIAFSDEYADPGCPPCISELGVMNTDGTGRTRLTDDFTSMSGPTWTPDGSRISFWSRRGLDTDVWVISPDRTHLTQVTAVDNVYSFAWEPPDRGRFGDVGTVALFHGDVEWLATQGITRGCNPPANTMFCPNQSVTRGQMAAFLTRALGLPAAPSAGFVDTVGSTFENDIDRLAAAGITRGCNPPANDRFCPDDPVRREVMAAFMVRALGYSDDGGGDLFVDDDDSIFEGDVDRLATAGVTRGCNPPVNDRFCPGSNVTRGQMAAFLHRALG